MASSLVLLPQLFFASRSKDVGGKSGFNNGKPILGGDFNILVNPNTKTFQIISRPFSDSEFSSKGVLKIYWNKKGDDQKIPSSTAKFWIARQVIDNFFTKMKAFNKGAYLFAVMKGESNQHVREFLEPLFSNNKNYPTQEFAQMGSDYFESKKLENK